MDLIVVVLSGTAVPSSAVFFFVKITLLFLSDHYIFFLGFPLHHNASFWWIVSCFCFEKLDRNSQEITMCYNLRSHRLYNKKKEERKKNFNNSWALLQKKKCSEHEKKCWLIMAQFWCWGIWCRSKTSINVQIVCYVLFILCNMRSSIFFLLIVLALK